MSYPRILGVGTANPPHRFSQEQSYIANALSDTVTIDEIDARTGTLQEIGSVVSGNFPIAIAINPDGKYYLLHSRRDFIDAG